MDVKHHELPPTPPFPLFNHTMNAKRQPGLAILSPQDRRSFEMFHLGRQRLHRGRQKAKTFFHHPAQHRGIRHRCLHFYHHTFVQFVIRKLPRCRLPLIPTYRAIFQTEMDIGYDHPCKLTKRKVSRPPSLSFRANREISCFRRCPSRCN